MRKRLLALGAALVLSAARFVAASDYLFLNDRYLQLTKQVLDQADAAAPAAFDIGSTGESTYRKAADGLRQEVEDITHAELFKKLKPEMVAQVKDQEFAANLNTFKFGLNFMASKAAKTPSQMFPSYDDWIKTETAVVSAGVDQRLKAFQTRFGPDSEQVNFTELLLGELFLKGDEAGPSPWEPILRLSAVQTTTSGPGLVSSFETGMNYYFVKSDPPTLLHWIGISNHVGVAASLQYLNDPRLLRFQGRPAFGLMLHLDRKEVGASWDPDHRNVRLTLGYAFQFVPFLM